jgi:hypothetical protein
MLCKVTNKRAFRRYQWKYEYQLKAFTVFVIKILGWNSWFLLYDSAPTHQSLVGKEYLAMHNMTNFNHYHIPWPRHYSAFLVSTAKKCCDRQCFMSTEEVTAKAMWELVKLKNSVAWVHEQTIPTERQPFVEEVSANFYGQRVPHGQHEGFLRLYYRLSLVEIKKRIPGMLPKALLMLAKVCHCPLWRKCCVNRNKLLFTV